jgi:tripartite-type tricarboxylate transporter receptor subunit TctC
MRRHFLRALSGGLCFLLTQPLPAAYPDRPLRLVVPYAAGGATDFIARALSETLTTRISQPIIVENRPGAATIIAAEHVARASADGYTLLLGDTATFAINPTLYPKLPYDVERAFEPVAPVARIPLLLVAHDRLPVTDYASWLAFVRARPASLSYASPGIGSPHHLAMELLQRAAGFDAVHVPYKGAAPALVDLIGGRVHFMFLDLPTGRSQIEAGRVRVVAVANRDRLPALPDVPTLDENGVNDFEAVAWQGIVAPGGTPAPVIVALNREITAALQTPELRQRFAQAGILPFIGGAEQLGAHIRQEAAKWSAVIRSAAIKVE